MKPILFNTEQVRNILDERKTNTRIPIKQSVVDRFILDDGGSLLGSFSEAVGDCYPTVDDAPHQVGDVLYVRETWMPYATIDSVLTNTNLYVYRADADGDNVEVPTTTGGSVTFGKADGLKWRPSIHMPKDAARIFLKVTDVRVERAQDITEEDAIKEGETGVRCECLHKELGGGMYGCTDCMNTGWLEPPTMEFMYDWNAIYAKRGYSFESNPWVWVYEFERMKGANG